MKIIESSKVFPIIYDCLCGCTFEADKEDYDKEWGQGYHFDGTFRPMVSVGCPECGQRWYLPSNSKELRVWEASKSV